MTIPVNFTIRLDETDKRNLQELAALLRLRKADTFRFIVNEKLNTLKAAQLVASTQQSGQAPNEHKLML